MRDTDSPWHVGAPIAWIPNESDGRIFLSLRRADSCRGDNGRITDVVNVCVRMLVVDDAGLHSDGSRLEADVDMDADAVRRLIDNLLALLHKIDPLDGSEPTA
jgi:hypothetical protein